MTDGGDRGGGANLRVLRGGVSDRSAADEALLQSFLEGDDDAFDALVRRHEELVLRIVRRWTRDADDARDLAQKTFVRAFEAARRTYEHPAFEKAPFRRWLIRIAVNLSRNHSRDVSRWLRAPAADAEAQPSHAADPDAALVANEQALRLRRAVLQLPRRQREVVALRLDAELPFAEIAAALDITENAAKVSFHLAAKRLRELLTGEGWP